MHLYESSHGKLPPGNLEAPRTSFCAFLFPYLEESLRLGEYDFALNWSNQPDEIQTAMGAYLPIYHCPSDESQIKGSGTAIDQGIALTRRKGNYGVNWGTKSYGEENRESPFGKNYGAALREIVDGASKTLAMLELIQAPSETGEATDKRGDILNEGPGNYQVSTILLPNDRLPDHTRCSNRPEMGLPCVNLPGQQKAESHLASRSRHPAGVLILLCDGSTHFLSNGVDSSAYLALSTRDGAEVKASF